MAKQHTQYICTECGYLSIKWLGKCPECSAWNSFQEQLPDVSAKPLTEGTARPVQALAATTTSLPRIATHSKELDVVFGGGIQPGSLTLLSGEPGIGKSTLVLTLCAHLAANTGQVLYISGEESLGQISDRARRLGLHHDELQFLQSNSIEDIIATSEREQPRILIIDSIQVMASQQHTSFAGSITQIRLCTELLLEYAKPRNITVFIIGHVTKEGNLAGPRVLEHLVDSVFMLEGDRGSQLRLLRALKNRFGPTDEVGVFAMEEQGLVDVTNPSALFLAGRNTTAFGSSITALREGNRAFLIEIQALTSYTKFGYPKRTSVGFDTNRLHIILAILSRYTKINLDNDDVYVNVVGGLRPKETAMDLAVALSIASSKRQVPLPADCIFLGELGLTGELRSVPFLERRLKEAEKLGCTRALIPHMEKLPKSSMELLPVKTIRDACALLNL